MKKISVVIPTYKRIELLQKCLHCLEKQTFPKGDFEVLVISDGPDDKTKLLLAKQFSWMKYDHTCEKKGPAAARNLGWLKAQGKLIAFTDDDCLPEAEWLERLWKSYQGEDEVAFSGRVIVPLSKNPTDFELNTANLASAEFITANCACTKQALIQTGGFDERFALAWREDSDLHFKLITRQISLKKTDATVVHPVRAASPGISLKEQRKGLYNALLYKKFPGLYRTKIGTGVPWNYYAIVLSFCGMLIFILIQSQLFFGICLMGWITLTALFFWKRIKKASKSVAHVTEMAITSLFIPFLSVYWQLYGAIKYRVLFI